MLKLSKQSVTENNTIEETKQEEQITETKEEINKPNNAEIKNTKSNQATTTKSTETNTKSTTNTETKKSVTVPSQGEYDIKNGGSAIYTESVPIPAEWLD